MFNLVRLLVFLDFRFLSHRDIPASIRWIVCSSGSVFWICRLILRTSDRLHWPGTVWCTLPNFVFDCSLLTKSDHGSSCLRRVAKVFEKSAMWIERKYLFTWLAFSDTTWRACTTVEISCLMCHFNQWRLTFFDCHSSFGYFGFIVALAWHVTMFL